MSAPPAHASESFHPEEHLRELRGIVQALRERSATESLAGTALDPILKVFPRAGRGFFSRGELIAGLRHLAEVGEVAVAEAESLAKRIQLRPVRTRSGVTPLTILTKPYPCPGRCVFCPNDVRMPKSYLSDEPGAQRAAANDFDPYRQTWSRLAAFHAIGHPTDKIEVIVLGGTWSFYPEAYQIWFVKRCLDALHDFGEGRDERETASASRVDFERLPAQLDGRSESRSYNDWVGAFLGEQHAGDLCPPQESASWESLLEAQRKNESATSRCVGLVLETRPDRVSEEEVLRLRRLGCTKVQLGVQSLDDGVLRANQRGHDVDATRRAIARLRRAGFKIHAHWMPNLLGSTPEKDIESFPRLFSDPDLHPDELKIYPCSLIESAELMRFYERGEWRPYDHSELLSVLTAVLPQVPRDCRVTRVIRDISSDDIVAGNKLTNFRELAERAVRERGGSLQDIRSREIRGEDFDRNSLELRRSDYGTGGGRELFLEWVTPADRILGFLRLSLPDLSDPGFIPEIEGCALIRELHVYGPAVELGRSSEVLAQHQGLGRSLIDTAVGEATAAGYTGLAVISAIGTRAYYRGSGFTDGTLYQVKPLTGTAGLLGAPEPVVEDLTAERRDGACPD